MRYFHSRRADTAPQDDTMPDSDTPSLKPLKWYRGLADAQGRLAAGVFLVEGGRAVQQIVRNHPGDVIEILSTEESPPLPRHYPVRLLTVAQFRTISGTQSPQGIAAIVRLPRETYTSSLPAERGTHILVLEDIQDPGNVGTLIRTAVAFGYSGLIMTEKCADPFSPKVVQAAAGTVLAPWLRRSPDYLQLVNSLQQDGYKLIATDVKGEEDTSVLSSSQRLLLALGNEATGISSPLLASSDFCLRLPIASEKAESLNVAVCGAICMYLSQHPC